DAALETGAGRGVSEPRGCGDPGVPRTIQGMSGFTPITNAVAGNDGFGITPDRVRCSCRAASAGRVRETGNKSPVPVVVPVEWRKAVRVGEGRRNQKPPYVLGPAEIMPTDHSLPALRRSASQAGRRRFDPGRPLSSNGAVDHAFLSLPRNRAT